MSITNGQNADPGDFINYSEKGAVPASDVGRVPKLESDGKIDEFWIKELSASKLISMIDILRYLPQFHVTSYGTNSYSNPATGVDGEHLVMTAEGGNAYAYLMERNNGGTYPAVTDSYTLGTSGTPSGTNWASGFGVTVGDYTYVMKIASQFGGSFPGQRSITRFDAGTLDNATGMSISGGTAFSGNIGNGGDPMFTDGTYIYVWDASTNWEKYSISGTTLTYVEDVTSYDKSSIDGVAHDGTNCYFLTSSGGEYTLEKFANDGSGSALETRVVWNSSSSVSADGETSVVGICCATTGVLYLVLRAEFSTSTTDNEGGAYYFLPVATS